MRCPQQGKEATTIEARTRLRPSPASAGEARRFASSTLHAWHRDTAIDVVELLVSELVTNAVLHARSEVELVLITVNGAVRVEVLDASPVAPVLRDHDDAAMTGRGLALVAELAVEWGVTPLAQGKAVWFTVAA